MGLLILVPTLNSFQLLPRLLSSLQQQDWPHWRLIFIDGPSSHEHRQWLKQCCAADSRCSWLEQHPAEPGIFGAMNQGFLCASPSDWLLFWGSDDWAAAPTVLGEAAAAIETASSNGMVPDLLVCRGRYAAAASGSLGRSSAFEPTGMLDAVTFRRALLAGSTPPHQATLFGPGARERLAHYNPGFNLSADLDYFLQLSLHPGLRVQCIDLQLVFMADSGVSGQQTRRRLQEVRRAYRRAFSWRWWFPFLMRYAKRMVSLLKWRR